MVLADAVIRTKLAGISPEKIQQALVSTLSPADMRQMQIDSLYDYSKGQWSAITATTTIQVWDNGTLVDATTQFNGKNTRKMIVKMCGFYDNGVGKMMGPDGSEIDTEAFLSDLHIIAGTGLTAVSGCTDTAASALPFRVVTQQYGKGIVSPTSNRVPTTFANGTVAL